MHSFAHKIAFATPTVIETFSDFLGNIAKKCKFSEKGGKEGNVWDFPHDCMAIDTYAKL